MKKIKVIIALLIISLLFGCSQLAPEPVNPNITKVKSQEIAYNFIKNDQNFIQSQGFDIELKEDKKLDICNSCWRFTYRYSVLSEELGYEVQVDVNNGVAELHLGPNPIS